jgi:hypothetical protein
VNASIRLTFALLSLTLCACATAGSESWRGARAYRETPVFSEVAPRGRESSPSVLTSHERVKAARDRGNFASTRFGH